MKEKVLKKVLNNKSLLVFIACCSLLASSNSYAQDSALITADLMQVNKKEATLLLQGKVKVRKQLTGSLLKAEKLWLHRHPVTGEILKAEAQGDVFLQEKDITFTGDYVLFDRQLELVELRGHVRLKSNEFSLEADHVIYHLGKEQGKITAAPGDLVRFTAYKALESQLEKATILPPLPLSKQGKSAKTAPPRQKIVAEAKEMMLFKKAGKAILQGKVKVVDNSDQSTFSSDRAEVFFDQNNNVEELIAMGNFTMSQVGRLSSADRADFDYRSEKVLLSGNALVRESKQFELRSSRVEMFLDVSKGIVSGADENPIQMKITIP